MKPLLLFVFTLSQASGVGDQMRLEQFASRIEAGETMSQLADDARILIKEPNESPVLKVRLLSLLQELAVKDPDKRALDIQGELLGRVEVQAGQFEPRVQLQLANNRVSYLTSRNDFAGAAEYAVATLEKFKPNTDPNNLRGTIAKVPKLLYRAGNKDAALDFVRNIWVDYPNDYAVNEAARAAFADALRDTGDPQLAFDLLDELRQSFDSDFRKSVYVVQNYLDYGSEAPHSDDPAKRIEVLRALGEFAEDLLPELDMPPSVDFCLYFSTGKIFHLLMDKEKALHYYQLAQEHADESEFGNMIRGWSKANSERINNGNLEDIIEHLYGREFVDMVDRAQTNENMAPAVQQDLAVELETEGSPQQQGTDTPKQPLASSGNTFTLGFRQLQYIVIGILVAVILAILLTRLRRKNRTGS